MYSWIRSASSWNVELVVRPQPGQAVTLGENDRRPSACNSSQAAYTSSRRSPFGRGVSETRIVSPIPSLRSTPIGEAEVQRLVGGARQRAVDRDQIAWPRRLARDDDLILA